LCNITLYDEGTEKLYRAVFSRLREIEDRMSITVNDTDAARINELAGIEPVMVHQDVIEVIERALYYAELSGGVFDPTIGPLVKLWGIGGENPGIPGEEELAHCLPLINWRDVEIDRAAGTVFLRKPGMALDLGAIAKGYAGDEALRILREAKVKRGVIDLGGNIVVFGTKKDKSPWRIGIQDPSSLRGSYLGTLGVGETAVVTSGVYERYFEEAGRRYHHILSPRDGYPVQNGLLSVTIVTARSIDADGLSTTVFALGYERGKDLIESLDRTEAIFVFEDHRVRLSSGLQEGFIISSENFTLDF
jgi:thiamine biosynthesis lipoprotein